MIEDNNRQVENQLKLTKQNCYLLTLSQVNSNALQQQILMLFNSKYSNNEIKKMIKLATHVIQTLNSIFLDNNFNRIYKIVKKATDSFSNICSHLIQELEKQKLGKKSICKCKQNNNVAIQNKDKQVTNQCDEIQQKMQMKKKRVNKMGGISLFNESYLRNLDVSTEGSSIQQKLKKLKYKRNNSLEVDEKEYKKNLFQKMRHQLKQVQQQVYSPLPDDISNFLIFQRKFLQTFNHLSHAESIQLIVKYLDNSHFSATQMINKSEDTTQQISKFKTQMQNLVTDIKAKNKDRNQLISNKFQQLLRKFMQQRITIFQQTKQQLDYYRKIFQQRQGAKVQIGISTQNQQLSTIKYYEQQLYQMESKYKIKQQQKQICFKQLLSKIDEQKNCLYAEIAQHKINLKKLTQEYHQISKQNRKFKQVIIERKQKSKNKQKINEKLEQQTNQPEIGTIKQIINNQQANKHVNKAQNVDKFRPRQKNENEELAIQEKKSSIRQFLSKKIQKIKTQNANGYDVIPEIQKFGSIAQIIQQNKTTTLLNIKQSQSIFSGSDFNFPSIKSQKISEFKQRNEAKSLRNIKSKKIIKINNKDINISDQKQNLQNMQNMQKQKQKQKHVILKIDNYKILQDQKQQEENIIQNYQKVTVILKQNKQLSSKQQQKSKQKNNNKLISRLKTQIIEKHRDFKPNCIKQNTVIQNKEDSFSNKSGLKYNQKIQQRNQYQAQIQDYQDQANLQITQAFSIFYKFGHFTQILEQKTNKKSKKLELIKNKIQLGEQISNIAHYIENNKQNYYLSKIKFPSNQKNSKGTPKNQTGSTEQNQNKKIKHISISLKRQKLRCFSTDEESNEIRSQSFFHIKSLLKNQGSEPFNYRGNLKIKKRIIRQLQIDGLKNRIHKQNSLKNLKQFNQTYLAQKNKYHELIGVKKVRRKKLQFDSIYKKSKQQISELKSILPQINIKQLH